MKRITIILEKANDPVTGGQKYDLYFLNKLKSMDVEFCVISDDSFRYSKFFPSFFYNIGYLYFWKTLIKTNVLIVNSRLYPRLFFFLSLFKFFSKRDIKLFAFHHHYNFMVHESLQRKIHKYFEIGFLKKMSVLIIPSKYILQTTKTILPKIRTELIEIAFENKFNTVDRRYSRELVFVGKIEHRKGLHLLIEAMKYIDIQCQINLIGSFNPNHKYFLYLKDQIKALDLEEVIIFKGRLEEKEKDYILKRSSVFVFPSLHEGYGMVMMEAMSYGLPVVAFDNSSIPFIVKNNYNGLVAKNKDVRDFAKKIKLLLSDQKLYEELSSNAKIAFEECRKNKDIDSDIEFFYSKYLK